MDPTKDQHQIMCKSREKCNEDPGNGYKSVRGKSMSRTRKSPSSPRPKKARHVQSKVKSMLIIIFDIKRTVHKEFVLAGQTVNSTYCDILRRLRENVRKNWLLHQDNAPIHTSFFIGEFLTKNNMTVIPHSPYFSVSPIKDKTERPPFSHNCGDRVRIAGDAERPHRIWLPGCI
jgi:hypothetical protein